MMLLRSAVRSLSDGSAYRLHQPQVNRAFSTNWNFVDGNNKNQNPNTLESDDDFGRRMFDMKSGDSTFYQKLDKVERAFSKSGLESDVKGGPTSSSNILDGLHESFNTLSDGMDGKLSDAATYFEFNADEIDDENYTYRPDMNLDPGMTYVPKDLDLRKPGVYKPKPRWEFQTTTKEVLGKADFRNIRFLANFLTEAGIMLKRSHTGISAKAQRKVAREIKTARAFGLLPFTTMGTKAFKFGKTMESVDEDYQFEGHADPDADTAFLR